MTRLIVVGHNEVAENLMRLADLLGYAAVTASDELPDDLGKNDDVVVALDEDDASRARELLRRATAENCHYIGLVAPQKQAIKMITALSRERMPKTRLDRIAAPAGVNIGAETPGEMAVAVAAELVARHRSGQTPLLDHAANQSAARRKGKPS
jgi:xanthine dehydrogenase accessory factor